MDYVIEACDMEKLNGNFEKEIKRVIKENEEKATAIEQLMKEKEAAENSSSSNSSYGTPAENPIKLNDLPPIVHTGAKDIMYVNIAKRLSVAFKESKDMDGEANAAMIARVFAEYEDEGEKKNVRLTLPSLFFPGVLTNDYRESLLGGRMRELMFSNVVILSYY
jgi:hypothetical protein